MPTHFAVKTLLEHRPAPRPKGKRKAQQGAFEYLVQWEGQDPATGRAWEPSWEPTVYISPRALEEYFVHLLSGEPHPAQPRPKQSRYPKRPFSPPPTDAPAPADSSQPDNLLSSSSSSSSSSSPVREHQPAVRRPLEPMSASAAQRNHPVAQQRNSVTDPKPSQPLSAAAPRRNKPSQMESFLQKNPSSSPARAPPSTMASSPPRPVVVATPAPSSSPETSQGPQPKRRRIVDQLRGQ